MALENGELLHVCSPEHLRMGTARMKYDNETEEEGKKRRMNVERSSADRKKIRPLQVLCRVQSLTTVSLKVLVIVITGIYNISSKPKIDFIVFVRLSNKS